MSVPRIKEVGPSFKADDEHFRVFILDDGRCAFVIGDVSWGRGQPIPLRWPDGVKIQFCKDLEEAQAEWEKCAVVLEDILKAELSNQLADRLRDAWASWSKNQRGASLVPTLVLSINKLLIPSLPFSPTRRNSLP